MLNQKEEQKKLLEKRYLNDFSKVYTLPEGEIKSGEQPDFTINELELGIEVTNLYVKDGEDLTSFQKQESLQKYAISEAQKYFEGKDSRRFDIHINFLPEFCVENPRKLGREIANHILKMPNNSLGNIEGEYHCPLPEISSMFIFKPLEASPWRFGRAANIKQIDKKHLLKVIEEKEKQAEGYKKCKELWLLIIIDFDDLGQDQEIGNIEFDPVFSERFSKIFLFKTRYNVFRELTVIPRQVTI